ncbi:MAG: FCD domain-containing protein, partial [Pseudomonadota bacterium]
AADMVEHGGLCGVRISALQGREDPLVKAHCKLNAAVLAQISDREFHTAIFAAAGNPVLANFATQAYAHAYRYRREIMRKHGGIELAVSFHERILAALQGRDPDAAEAAMFDHISSVTTLLSGVEGAGGSARQESSNA